MCGFHLSVFNVYATPYQTLVFFSLDLFLALLVPSIDPFNMILSFQKNKIMYTISNTLYQ